MDVITNLANIETKVQEACEKVNRKTDEITIIGVTKYVTIERTEEAIRSGITNIGENRAEELTKKYSQIQDKATWHFIGTLQSRKVKDVIDKVDVIHSLDRMSVAKQIDKRASSPIDCFIQVNVSGEEAKHGLAPNEVLPFIKELEPYKNVRIVGLMTMAPHVEDESLLRRTFKDLAALRDMIQHEQLSHAPCAYLSMGMSNDYEIAIEEGATHIRIGSKLVGAN
ncbi:YggS family pyridoxal phosphate-dependent enzyme [Virgibacillus sp. W0181]|uniref:YggS family pyridoxal phosphate-dependent enzyme n=1 Tax=Virgibacillus sp. W0181 TaxID=3391581 RepID=UPI003F45510E